MKKPMLTCAVMLLVATTLAAGELAIGADAPGFALINASDGRYVKFDPKGNDISVVVFTCNQCPYARAFEPRLVDIGKKYAERGVAFYAINPNDESKYPVETIGNMKKRAVTEGYPFPYLKDTDSSVARAYGARVTPHVFVIDGAGKVRYRGYVDDSAKPSERAHTGLTDAIDSLLKGERVIRETTKAFGCPIKWRT